MAPSMPVERVRSIAILGGGTAGWLAAATLARRLKPDFCALRLIDSGSGTGGGFSEVALPSFHRLNGLLGIAEGDLMRQTLGTFRLGTRFAHWGRSGEQYFHTSGSIGAKLDAVPFHHYWLKLRELGGETSLEDYSTATVAARQGRFAPPGPQRSSFLSSYSYGYHFHAALLAAYLRHYALEHGVVRTERNIVQVQLRGEDGFVDALQLDDGSQVRADLYIDCTNGRALWSPDRHGGFEDWSQWFACDRSVAVLCDSAQEAVPYSLARAERCGWSWRIPLQRCIDSGLMYSSNSVSDDEATATLLADLPGARLTDVRNIKWSPGRPTKFWDRNCITLASGGLEPLECTALHLVQTGVARLLTLFPVSRYSPHDIEEYNRLTGQEWERIRDFLILHYKATSRADSPFWDRCRKMEVPATLRARMDLFQRCGRLAMQDDEHFGEESWLSLLLGQGVYPQDYDPLADVLDVEQVQDALLRMRIMVRDGVEGQPTMARFIAGYCAAGVADIGATG